MIFEKKKNIVIYLMWSEGWGKGSVIHRGDIIYSKTRATCISIFLNMQASPIVKF
jgi:hypothetical protein